MRYLLAIIALGGLVALHVLGHALLARLFGVRLERFTFGFGPAMFTLDRGGTKWVLGMIPLGGSVLLEGSNPHDHVAVRTGPGSFLALSAWKRVLIYAAGPLTTVLFAFVLLVGLYAAGTHVPVPLTIGTVMSGSEAARATLRPGDVIHALEGVPVANWSEFVTRIAGRPDQELELGILREGAPVQVKVVPRKDVDGIGRLGVRQQYVFRQHALGEAVTSAGSHVKHLAEEGVGLLVSVVEAEDEPMHRPLALTRQASRATRAGGLDGSIRVVVALAMLLALFNLLPLPGLDGGRMLLAGIEAVTRRVLPPKVETLLHFGGLLGMLLLIAVVALGDARGRLLALMGSGNSQPAEDVTGPTEPEPALPLEAPDAGTE